MNFVMGRLASLGCFVSCLALAAASTFALAQMDKPATPAIGSQVPPAQVYGKLLSGMEKELVDLAEAMPADKYGFVPTAGEFKGARSFGAQVKHVAEANYYFFAGPEWTEAQDKAKTDEIEKLTSKDDIVKALKESFVLAHKYVDGITAKNAFEQTKSGTRGGMAAFGMAHFMDHYGQMVEYARMNGIVPPASRGGM